VQLVPTGLGPDGHADWIDHALLHMEYLFFCSDRLFLPPCIVLHGTMSTIFPIFHTTHLPTCPPRHPHSASLKKAASRAGTTLMQKTGQIERTVDREFAEEEGRYRT
jgi:hypothetical protein